MILDSNEQFEIRPFKVKDHLWNAFDHYETEVSAAYIVRLCYERGGWYPFSREDIERVYQAAGHKDRFTFNALITPVIRRTYRGTESFGGGYIAQVGNLYFVTDTFVYRVYRAAQQ